MRWGKDKMATKKAPKAVKKGKKLGSVKPLMAHRSLKKISPLMRPVV